VGPLANTQKNCLETMVNPDGDGYRKTLNHRKSTPKNEENNNSLNSKKNTKT